MTDRRGLPSLGPVLELMRLLWAVDHGYHRTSKRMQAELGVTAPQRLVVRLVGRFPGLTAGQLASALNVHPSTVTGFLKRLERQGLVTRRADPRDRRRSFLGLTAAGRAVDETAKGTIEAAVEGVLKRLPADKIEAAREVLAAIARAFEDSAS